MKKLFLLLLFIFPEISFAQKDLKLTCTVDGGSFFDNVEFYSDKKVGLTSFNNRFFDILDLYVYPDSYLLSGEHMNKEATIRYTINRTTGKFERIVFFKGSTITNSSNGFCKKVENKF
jgi:hypothetical protein